MFTKSWYVAQGAHFIGDYNGEITVKSVTGKDRKVTASSAPLTSFWGTDTAYLNATLNYVAQSYETYGGVIFGDGTVAATVDDTRLSGNLISGFTYSKVLTKTISDTKVELSVLYTITNTGSAAFTISEVGLISASGTSGKSEDYKVLWERTLLDNPVTIEPGGVGQVTYTLTMNLPA